MPVPGYEVRLVDENGADVADGEIGELLVRGPTAAEGYWNQREKTRRTFEGEWTRTGDKYTRDADGLYTYCGRTDDMFKVCGMWVSPFEVESALIAHPPCSKPRWSAGGRRWAVEAEGVHRAGGRQEPPTAAKRSRSTSSGRSGRGNIRAGSRSWIHCRRPRPERSSASSCGRTKWVAAPHRRHSGMHRGAGAELVRLQARASRLGMTSTELRNDRPSAFRLPQIGASELEYRHSGRYRRTRRRW